MSYTKNTWVDQDVERPRTYEVTKNQDGSITLTDSFGLVQELGTPVNEVNMNHIEDGIAGCAIRKHNLTETFNFGEWVLGGTGDDEGIYKSLIDNNVGNAITDDTKWEKVEMGGGASRNIGEIVASTIPLTDAGLHLLDGSLISGSGIYADFVTYIAGLVSTYPNLFVAETSWQSSVTQYGVCGKFVYDSTNNTVRLPKITGKIDGTTDINALGDLVEQYVKLPNITGAFNGTQLHDGSPVATGAFASGGAESRGTPTSDVDSSQSGFNFNASRSSSVYSGNGTDTTIHEQAINVLYYIVIATSTKTDIQVDIDNIATDLNGKADTDLTNTTDSAKVLMSSMGMPSDKHIDLTLGASGTTYTAPANGWVSFCVEGNANGLFGLNNLTITGSARISTFIPASAKGITYRTFMPIMKNSKFAIEFYNSVTPKWLIFIYAQGSESEAQ